MKFSDPGYSWVLEGNRYLTATPSTVLRALNAGLVHPDLFVFRMGNVKPLLEEPYDLREIERILAKPVLEQKTALLLVEIFQKLVHSPDAETALFAAESWNLLENRYTKKIQNLQKLLITVESEADKPLLLRRTARTFFQLGRLQVGRPEIRQFYFNEALQLLKTSWKMMKPRLADAQLMVQLLIETGHISAAVRVVRSNLRAGRSDPKLLVAWADLEFRRGNLNRVFRIVRLLRRQKDLPKGTRRLIRHWRSFS
ncbi:MAG: hypothetical protein HKM06_09055 [Spirochaetales bacterium]|nr:hypothetical protein [Spirochaetales bacterium]